MSELARYRRPPDTISAERGSGCNGVAVPRQRGPLHGLQPRAIFAQAMSSEHRSLASLARSDAPATTAFVFDGTPVTRSQFVRRVEQAAAWLAAHGIGPGDVIAVWLVNRLEWVALLFAAARLGAIVAAVNTRYRSAEVEHLLRLSAAKLLVVEAHFRSIDFPAILAGIDKAAVPGLERVAVVGAGDMTAPWPCVPFDAFEADYPAAPAPQDDLDAPV